MSVHGRAFEAQRNLYLYKGLEAHGNVGMVLLTKPGPKRLHHRAFSQLRFVCARNFETNCNTINTTNLFRNDCAADLEKFRAGFCISPPLEPFGAQRWSRGFPGAAFWVPLTGFEYLLPALLACLWIFWDPFGVHALPR